ncbi:MAG: hypothetical protein NTV46_01800 [Verrucomicrobia bacterium]|nr:hypothetical protein [Verrucomicrobiota bacterium]
MIPENNCDRTIGELVLREFFQPTADWSKYTLDQIQRTYASLIGWRKETRRRTKQNNEEWLQNGVNMRIIQSVLAKKWAERGKPALIAKIIEMETHCSNPDRINNYDDLLLAELRTAYSELKVTLLSQPVGDLTIASTAHNIIGDP